MIGQIPPEKQGLLEAVTERLARVRGVKAVALGGSYARGTQHAGSDLDVAIYYHEAEPFAIPEIQQVAAGISESGTAEVTDFYGWGPWVNGGGWIHTPAGKVDFIYRNVDQVQRTIHEAKQGISHHDYYQQPAYGFYSVIYLGETRVCVPLYDPEGLIAGMKEQVAVYPPRLKEATIQAALWLAEFSLIHAEGYAKAGEVYTAAGALTRTASFLVQTLFALNETYYMNDKTAMREAAAFPIAPAGFVERIRRILGAPGQTAAELEAAVRAMREVWASTVALTGGSYRPAFKL